MAGSGSSLAGKKILLAVSGGIAAYKSAEILRQLMRQGAEVWVAMTKNAKQFVTPLTFEALSGKPVYHEIFETETSASMPHIRAAESADLMIVAPATANTIGKMAQGLAEDPVSTLFISFAGPVMIAPAMNDQMWANIVVQENLDRLKKRGVRIIDPEAGELACGSVGPGRLADPEIIVGAICKEIARTQDLKGKRILVSAGPTREPIDPVRFITNHSSGKMGYAIARQAQRRGAQVTLVSGPTALDIPSGVKFLKCLRTDEMRSLLMEHFPECDVLIMAAAVGDFSPETIEKEKIKKTGEDALTIRLQPTPDILKELASQKKNQLLVGFAAESQNLIQSALEKMQRKGLDMIVANDISAPGIGFQSDDNQVTVITGADSMESLPKMPKADIADQLLDRVLKKL